VSEEASGPLEALDHVVIAVRDLASAADDYAAFLGRKPSWYGEHPDFGTANVLFRLGNAYVELLAPVREAPFADVLRARLDAGGEGLWALAFRCADADACAAELRRRGLHPFDPAAGSGRESRIGAERRWRNLFLPDDETRGIPLFAIEHLSPPDALPLAEPTGDGSAAVAELDHVVVLTKDADSTRQLYGDRLGIRLALDRTFEKFGSRLLFFRLGGITIEAGASLGAAVEPERPDALWGVAYRVPDVTRSQARIAAAGIDVSEVRKGRKEGTRVCTVRGGTHGVATLLIGPGGPEAARL